MKRKLTTLENELISHVAHYNGMRADIDSIKAIYDKWNDCYLDEAFHNFLSALNELEYAIVDQAAGELQELINNDGVV